MHVYIYKGPVESFGKCIDQWWEAETCAESAKKARSNLTYRYKKEHGLVRNMSIVLPGKIQRKEN